MNGPLFSAAKLASAIMSPEEAARFKAQAKYVLYCDADGRMLLDECRTDRMAKADGICAEALKVFDKYAVRKNRTAPFPLIGASGEHYPAVQSIMDKLREFLKPQPSDDQTCQRCSQCDPSFACWATGKAKDCRKFPL